MQNINYFSTNFYLSLLFNIVFEKVKNKNQNKKQLNSSIQLLVYADNVDYRNKIYSQSLKSAVKKILDKLMKLK